MIRRKVRILVVDDSSVVRRILSNALGAEDGMTVSGTAANGRIALQKMENNRPDLVILDVDMPEMDGLETLEAMGKLHPGVPVIMFSVLTERGAQATLQALFRGAQDYVAKPSGASSAEDAIRAIQQELIPKIRALAGRPALRSSRPGKTHRRQVYRPRQIDAVLVAASTGGPAALQRFLGRMEIAPPVPLLIVQHMPKLFTAYLARQLSSHTGLKIEEASDGQKLEKSSILIAPGGRHMRVARKKKEVVIRLDDGAPVNSCRPSADVLFLSAAELWGGSLLGVVLTGMGRDGLQGCRSVHRSGGLIYAQDEASSVVWGMPGYVVEEELAEHIAPPEELGAQMLGLIGPKGKKS